MIRMSLLVVLASVALASAASADFDKFSRRGRPVALFEPAPEEPKDKAANKPAPKADEDEGTSVYADDEGSPRKVKAPPGSLSIAVWLTPFVRVTTDPEGAGGGFGFEVAHNLTDQFGLMFAASVWNYSINFDDDDGDEEGEEANGVELETGGRFRPLEWGSGAIYFDLRVALGFVDGPRPIRSTTNFGGDWRVGFEFGRSTFRLFLEGGISWRGAINHGDAGWLDVNDSNGSGGIMIELLRIGLRFYL